MKEIDLEDIKLLIKYSLYEINTLLKRRNIETNIKYLMN